jgi:hypothetical protein
VARTILTPIARHSTPWPEAEPWRRLLRKVGS